MNNNNGKGNNGNNGLDLVCNDTPAQHHNPHCNTNTEEPTMPDTNDHIELCNTVVCDDHGNPITEEDNTMDNLCTEEFINAPFCQGPSEQDEGSFTPPPFDCFAGPDYGTQEYIDSNWGQQLIDNGCVELGEPQTIEKDDVLVELGPATVIEREEETTTEVTEPAADILPETGLDTLGFGLIGVLLVVVGVAVLRRFRKVEEVEPCGYCGDSLNPNDICWRCFPCSYKSMGDGREKCTSHNTTWQEGFGYCTVGVWANEVQSAVRDVADFPAPPTDADFSW